MSKKISITITDEQLTKVKKIYELTKNNKKDFSLSFDEFLEKLITSAFNTHLQFSEMNESMNKVFKDLSETMGVNDFKMSEQLSDLDSMVQEIFKKNMSENEKKMKDNTNNQNNNKKMKN